LLKSYVMSSQSQNITYTMSINEGSYVEEFETFEEMKKCFNEYLKSPYINEGDNKENFYQILCYAFDEDGDVMEIDEVEELVWEE